MSINNNNNILYIITDWSVRWRPLAVALYYCQSGLSAFYSVGVAVTGSHQVALCICFAAGKRRETQKTEALWSARSGSVSEALGTQVNRTRRKLRGTQMS